MTSLKGGLISEGILTLFDMLDMKLNQANAPEAIGGGTGGKSWKEILGKKIPRNEDQIPEHNPELQYNYAGT